MADTTVQANNLKVQFQGKPMRERPAGSADKPHPVRHEASKLMRRGVISKKQHDKIVAALGR